MKVAQQTAPIPSTELNAYVVRQNEQLAGTRSHTWLPSWLPIASDSAGGELFVDLREGPRSGCVTAFAADAGSGAEPAWADVAAMLVDIAGRLERDDAQVDDQGQLYWR